jgi:hypothetical protein
MLKWVAIRGVRMCRCVPELSRSCDAVCGYRLRYIEEARRWERRCKVCCVQSTTSRSISRDVYQREWKRKGAFHADVSISSDIGAAVHREVFKSE